MRVKREITEAIRKEVFGKSDELHGILTRVDEVRVRNFEQYVHALSNAHAAYGGVIEALAHLQDEHFDDALKQLEYVDLAIEEVNRVLESTQPPLVPDYPAVPATKIEEPVTRDSSPVKRERVRVPNPALAPKPAPEPRQPEVIAKGKQAGKGKRKLNLSPDERRRRSERMKRLQAERKAAREAR